MNLIDDLSSRGVLKDTKVKEMVDAHLKDMEGKIGELNGQKDRQKTVLTARLDQKLKGLEEELVARHQVRTHLHVTTIFLSTFSSDFYTIKWTHDNAGIVSLN